MSYDPNIHHRRSIRLRDYDYTQAGAYFVTICAYSREWLFGDIADSAMHLNGYGEIVVQWWSAIAERFQNVELDVSVVMPNHMHGIMLLSSTTDAKEYAPLGKIVAYFKYLTTKHINQARTTPGIAVWQRNYYEHIIRNDSSLLRIRQYITNNPIRWEEDQLHPSNPSKW